MSNFVGIYPDTNTNFVKKRFDTNNFLSRQFPTISEFYNTVYVFQILSRNISTTKNLCRATSRQRRNVNISLRDLSRHKNYICRELSRQNFFF